MTAVDFLIECLMKNQHVKENIHSDFIRLTKVFEQAKEMEKQQISDAWYAGDEDGAIHDFEQYYSETYGGRESDDQTPGIDDVRNTALSQTEISVKEIKEICKEVVYNTPVDATERELGYTIAMRHIFEILENRELLKKK